MKPGVLEKVTSTMVGEVVLCLLYSERAHSAAKYLDDKTVIRATRPVYTDRKSGRKSLDGDGARATRVGIVVTLGALNYRDREFAKACKRSGEPFPVKKIQIRRIP